MKDIYYNQSGEPLPWEEGLTTVTSDNSGPVQKKSDAPSISRKCASGCGKSIDTESGFCSEECRSKYWTITVEDKPRKRWTLKEMQNRVMEWARNAKNRNSENALIDKAREIFGTPQTQT